jgi:hypothetical protein
MREGKSQKTGIWSRQSLGSFFSPDAFPSPIYNLKSKIQNLPKSNSSNFTTSDSGSLVSK